MSANPQNGRQLQAKQAQQKKFTLKLFCEHPHAKRPSNSALSVKQDMATPGKVRHALQFVR